MRLLIKQFMPIAIAMILLCAAAAFATKMNSTVHGIYTVQTSDMPAIVYDGSIKGFAATKPMAGKKYDQTNEAAKQYQAYLIDRHNKIILDAGINLKNKINDITVTSSAFTIKLSRQEVMKLKKQPEVVSVEPVRILYSDDLKK